MYIVNACSHTGPTPVCIMRSGSKVSLTAWPPIALISHSQVNRDRLSGSSYVTLIFKFTACMGAEFPRVQ